MAQRDDLNLFVRDALAQGHDKPGLRQVLLEQGWSTHEVDEALDAWADAAFSPPVPKPRNVVSARDFFVYALTFTALVAGASYLVVLLHAIIDTLYEATGSWSNRRTIRTGVSVLLVTSPLYFWLTWRERRRLAADPGLYRSAIRKWVTYLTLLIAALVFGITLIATINAFLGGDLTGQFMLKALSVIGVSGGIFLFYLRETEPRA